MNTELIDRAWALKTSLSNPTFVSCYINDDDMETLDNLIAEIERVDELREIIASNAQAANAAITRLQTENAELVKKNNDLWAELTTACQKTAKDFRADELQAANKLLALENSELRERAHYAVVASDLSVERAEQAEAALRYLYELIASWDGDYYGPGLSDIVPEHRATIERLQEQSNEK